MVSGNQEPKKTKNSNACNPTAIPFPEPMDFGAQNMIAERWKLWLQKWRDFAVLVQLEDQPLKYQVAMFRQSIGDDGRKLLNSLNMTDACTTDLEKVIAALQDFCVAQVNQTFERFKFNSRVRRNGESVQQFVSDIRTLASTCQFCDCIRDSLIRDRIVLGIRNEALTKRLLNQRNLTLEQCINICMSEESTEAQFSRIIEPEASINAVVQRKHFQSATRNLIEMPDCRFCGVKHGTAKEQCPAWGRTCMKCGKKNHFARRCRSNRVAAVTENSEPEAEINNVGRRKNSGISAELLVNNHPVRFQLDTGASINIIPEKYVEVDLIKKDSGSLKMWNGSELQPKGVAQLVVLNPKDGKQYMLDFVVVAEDLRPILGLEATQELGFVQFNKESFINSMTMINDLVEQYPSVFDGGLGKFNGSVHLSINHDVYPVVLPARRVPFALKERLRTELERLVDMNVISKVDQPTDWVSQIAVVKKKDEGIRICIDPKPLNTALRREHYALPTFEDVLPNLSRATLFSKADLSSAFWHVSLDEESSYLTTFGTPFGRYRWNRLPFGLKVSSEIFQKRLIQAIDDLPGVTCVADDVLIFGATEAEHDKTLHAFLERCEAVGIKLKPTKLELKKTEIAFHGHLLTTDGVKPDPAKTSAISGMPKPTDVKAVSRLNGMVNYLSRFLPSLADVMKPIRKLTHKGEPWIWGTEQDLAFKKVKEMLANAPILAYFNPDVPLVVQCDSSQFGLGAVLLQNDKPLDYRSKTLTETEQRYAQIEKEMLAIVFALERFNDYTFGAHTTVYTDHRPLVSISKKPLCNVPKRLQRMIIRLQRYDYEIIYKPGTEMLLADTLSRAFLPDTGGEHHKFDNVQSTDYLAVSDKRLREIQDHTEADPTMCLLRDTILRGWPNDKRTLPSELTPYFKFRDEMTISQGLIFKGDTLLIPHALRRSVLESIHSAHLGINQCTNRARELFFWPGMSSQIQDLISSCELCQCYGQKPQKEPMMQRQIPERPWQMIACDLFHHAGKEYMVTVDYYSDFFEVDLLGTTTAGTVINKLRGHFARHGIPEIFVSDNGPQFASREFMDFSKKWNFIHRLTSPYHSQSNGKAESAVKEAKKLMEKAKEAGDDPYLYLLEKRNTPTTEMKSSPSQRLFGRRTRTLLPIKSKLLEPKTIQAPEVRTNLLKRMQTQKRYYDRGSKPLTEFDIGDAVWVQPMGGRAKWLKGIINGRRDLRSYEIDMGGATIRRNRVFLRKVQSPNKRKENCTTRRTRTQTADPTGMSDRRTRSGRCFHVLHNEAENTERRKDVMRFSRCTQLPYNDSKSLQSISDRSDAPVNHLIGSIDHEPMHAEQSNQRTLRSFDKHSNHNRRRKRLTFPVIDYHTCCKMRVDALNWSPCQFGPSSTNEMSRS